MTNTNPDATENAGEVRYELRLRDDSGGEETVEVFADADKEAIAAAGASISGDAADLCGNGTWPAEGASVDVCWELVRIDDDGEETELESGVETVDIEPRHAELIKAAVPYDAEHCGDDPDSHTWTSEGEGGCDANPGVWATGGTSYMAREHCRDCGLARVLRTVGSQRNPGEHDSVEYEWMDRGEL